MSDVFTQNSFELKWVKGCFHALFELSPHNYQTALSSRSYLYTYDRPPFLHFSLLLLVVAKRRSHHRGPVILDPLSPHDFLDMYTVCTYNYFMGFEWDQNKATRNLKKHSIDFADAVTVFDDFNSITVNDPDHDEERFVTIGMDAYGRILVVVYSWRGDVIRIISARKVTKHERKQYQG